MIATGCIQGDLDLPEFHLTDWTGDLPDPTLATLTLTTTEGMSVSSTSVSSTTDDTTSSTGDDSTSTGELPASVCDPQPEEIEVDVIVDGKVGWQHEPVEIVTPCLVTWVGNLGPMLHLGLACEDGPHTLDVTATGPSGLHVGEFVELGLSIQVPWWANVHAVVRRDGEVMVAATSADRLPIDPGFPSSDFFAPLQIALLDDVCAVEVPVDEPCDFICADPCTVDRRQALAFLDDHGAEVVYDRGSGQLGELAIDVGSAIEHVEVDCPDVPWAWYAFVAVRQD